MCKNHSLKCLLLALIVSFVCSPLLPLVAQHTGFAELSHPRQLESHHSLSLDSCISIARGNSPTLQRARLNRQNAQIEESSARSKFLPQVSASIGQGFDFGRSRDNTGVYVDRSSTATSFGVSFGVSLFSGFARLHALKAAKLGSEAAGLDIERVQNELDLQVVALYYNVLFKRELRKIADSQLAQSRVQVDRTEQMVQTGKWAENKNYEMQAQLSKDELALRRADNEIALAILELAQAMNVAPDGLDPASPDINDLVLRAASYIKDPAGIYDTALGWLPQIRAAEMAIKQATLRTSSARSGYLPSLDFSAGYNNGYFYNFGKQYESLNRSFADQWKQNGRSSVGLSLRIPIFDAFSTRDQVRRARTAEQLARLDLYDKKMQVYKEVNQAYLNAVNASGQMAVAQRAVEAMRKAFEAAELQFEVGKIGTYQYSDAKTKLSVAETELLQATYDLVYRARVLHFYRR